jgi:hypothetical protein
MPTNRVPIAVISVDNRIAAAIMAAPVKMGIELAKGARSDVTARYP